MEPTGDCKACTTVVDDDDAAAAAAAVVDAPSDVEEEEEGVCPPVAEDDSVDSFLAPSLIVDDQHQSIIQRPEKPEGEKNEAVKYIYTPNKRTDRIA